MNKHFALYILVTLLVSMNLVSCNKDDDTKSSSTITDYSVYSSATTLVSSFSLKANSKVMNNLDSVKFTIDQERGLIYNADSLPFRTEVDKLLVNLKCASTVATREFIVKGGIFQSDTTIVYTDAVIDTIDFTGNVTLRITSRDGDHSRDYKVKVNVRKQEPDTIVWKPSRRRDLPGMSGTVLASKTVQQNDMFMCLVQDNSSYILSESDDPAAGTWSKTTLSLPFEPQVNSFTATDDALYMLDINNQLYKSSNKGNTWVDCGEAWHTIIGAYGNRILGVMQEDGEWKHVEYPRPNGFEPVEIHSLFPITGMSQLVQANNGWTSDQQVMMVGGILADGNYTNSVWGYDGTQWGLLASASVGNALPKLRDASLVAYYTYGTASNAITPKRYVTWLVMGGVLEDGKVNETTFISRNQGLNWNMGAAPIQLPRHIPAFYGAQAYSFMRTMNKNGILKAYDPGQTTPITEWECPFIYLFGGYAYNGNALTSVWEGVLNRLTYKPVF